jgi:hypothetical protein
MFQFYGGRFLGPGIGSDKNGARRYFKETLRKHSLSILVGLASDSKYFFKFVT